MLSPVLRTSTNQNHQENLLDAQDGAHAGDSMISKAWKVPTFMSLHPSGEDRAKTVNRSINK